MKNKADFFAFLDATNGKVNGRELGHMDLARYILSTGEYITAHGRPVNMGGIRQWIYDYNKGEHLQTLPESGNGVRHDFTESCNKVRPVSKGIDPSINILDDDLDLEDGLSEYIEPYILQGEQDIFVLGDLHLPYQDIAALRIAVNYARAQKVNTVILNGDALDFYQLSRFDKKPDKPTIRHEIELCKQLLSQLRKLFPSEKIIFKIGNHEDRLEKYIYTRAPELFGIDALSLSELLDLKSLNIDLVKSTQLIQAGDLIIGHGHEIKAGGINGARNARMKANHSILINHLHRPGEDYKRSISDEFQISYVLGCLCKLHADWLPNNDWLHGFGIVKLFANGEFHVRNLKIVNGKVI